MHKLLKAFLVFLTLCMNLNASSIYNDVDVLWSFEQSSNLAADSAGDNHGTLHGNASWAAEGKYGGALYLDGSGDYISVPHSSDWEFGNNSFSISFWAKGITGLNSTVIQLSDSKLGASIGYWANNNILTWISSNGSSWDIASNVYSGTEPGNQWSNYLIVRNGNTFNTYKDGAQISSFSSSSSIYVSSDDMNIGRYRYTGGTTIKYMQGYLDEIAIWNRALNVSEISALQTNSPSVPEPASILLLLTTLIFINRKIK